MNDYSGIKESIARMLRLLKAKDAIELIPEFILLAEVRVYRNLRVPALEQVADLLSEVNGGFLVLPANFVEAKYLVRLSGLEGATEMRQRPLEEIIAAPTAETGETMFWARMDNMIMLRPLPEQQEWYRLVYYRQLDNLSTANPTNYVATSAPDVLIYGALMEAAPYLPIEGIPDTMVARYITLWDNKFKQAMSDLMQMQDAEYNGSRLEMRLR